jgi:hypothetical protein
MEIVQSTLFGISKQKIIGWSEAIPHVGFEYDMVWGIRHEPVADRLAVWRKIANDPTVHESKVLKFVEDYLKASENSSVQETEELRKEFKKYLAANIGGLLKKGAFRLISKLFDIVKKDYGHKFLAFRHFGVPVARYGNARQIGFYPWHLCEHIDNGVLSHCDQSLSPQRRVAEMLHYDRDHRGGVSNDEAEAANICGILQLSRVQSYRAIPAIRQAARKLYYSFNQREGQVRQDIQSCVGFGQTLTDLLRVEIPEELRVNMPAEAAVVMERLAAVDPFETSTSPLRFIPRAEMTRRNAAAKAEFERRLKPERAQRSTWVMTRMMKRGTQEEQPRVAA